MKKLNLTCGNVDSVLVEPSTKLPTHMCVAHSSSPLTDSADVVLQAMNIIPTPVTVYKSMKLATATPQHCVLLVSDISVVVDESSAQSPLLGKIDLFHLTPEEQTELITLLNDSLMPSHMTTLSQGLRMYICCETLNTNHSTPIHQPLHRILQTLSSTIFD